MILGLTGFSGAGKSTVAAILKENGFYHLDCDALVHDKVYKDPIVLETLKNLFGDNIIENGQLNRIALRHFVMDNPNALRKLNETVRPFILNCIEQHLQEHAHEDIILDAPLLFESQLEKRCNKVLSVVTNYSNAMERIMERDSLTEEEAMKRLKNQHPASFYTENSDYVIRNDHDMEYLKSQVISILSKLSNIPQESKHESIF